MKRPLVVFLIPTYLLVLVLSTAGALPPSRTEAATGKHLLLKNGTVVRDLEFDGHVWRTVRFARSDGSDELRVKSDEFHILFLDGQELTLDQYQATGGPIWETKTGVRTVTIRYVPRAGIVLPVHTPSLVTIAYSLGNDAYLHKTILLEMTEGEAIDRLEVERFSTNAQQSRGGRGEPVFVNGVWFFGVEYPAFCSRHTDGNTPAAYSGPYDKLGNYSFISLDGHDVDRHPRPGLIRLMHFPGYTRKLPDSNWGIISKTAVAGVGHRGDSIELAFLDYLNTIRRPVRSFLHYNNYFSREGRDLSVQNLVTNFFLRFRENLSPYGVRLDAMVIDDGWQNKKSIYSPDPNKFPRGMDDMAALSRAFEEAGTHMGIWMALNGYNSDIDWGKQNGYVEAERNQRFSQFHRYYSISSPQYKAKLRERLADLIARCHIQYIKHDFNEMADLGGNAGHLPTDRHGHEAEVDAELEYLALEREINNHIYQNITNWIWFSPWWLANGNNLWMLSGDSGEFRAIPELSTLIMAAAYRDVNLYPAWHDPLTRPLVPISHLMTHGIIYTENKYSGGGDSLHDFADFVMMYYMRGLQLKEWYINPRLLTKEQWEVLGRATRWSQEHVQTLANSVFVGGDPGKGEAYGYMCWNGDEGILSLRNPQPGEAEISVPFDATVWYRGVSGRPFRASVVYPYQGNWPVNFRSGEPMRLSIPGNTLLILHLSPGETTALPKPKVSVPEHVTVSKNGDFVVHLNLPDEAMQRCDLLLSSHGEKLEVKLDDRVLEPSRTNHGPGWQISSFDLQPWRGRQVELTIQSANHAGSAAVEAWWVMDRPIVSPSAENDPRLPFPVSQGFRRQTVQLMPATLQESRPDSSGTSGRIQVGFGSQMEPAGGTMAEPCVSWALSFAVGSDHCDTMKEPILWRYK